MGAGKDRRRRTAMRCLKRLDRDQRGIESLEYLLIAALVIVASAGAWRLLGGSVENGVDEMARALDRSVQNGGVAQADTPVSETPNGAITTYYPGQPKGKWDVDLCLQGGFGGLNGKACLGTGGGSVEISGGTVATAGEKWEWGWDGSRKTCGTIGAGGGHGVYVNGGGAICQDQYGNKYLEKGGGAGPGMGGKGWDVAGTVELTHTRNLTAASPQPQDSGLSGTAKKGGL
jgi:Flp pilus assembly pilin Flp